MIASLNAEIRLGEGRFETAARDSMSTSSDLTSVAAACSMSPQQGFQQQQKPFTNNLQMTSAAAAETAAAVSSSAAAPAVTAAAAAVDRSSILQSYVSEAFAVDTKTEEKNDPEEEEEEEDEDEEDSRFLEVCMDGDVDDLVQLLEEMAKAGETLTEEVLNMADQSGRTPASHLCGNGMIEMLELLEDIPGLDFNAPDTEGNTPLHFAAQAGHVEVVSFLLNKVRTIQVDPVNNLGFTPLMKAALQGRIKCSKLLLFSGASPVRRDFGRGLTASQWSRFCSRHLCADSIEKFIRTAVPGGEELQFEASGGGGGGGGSEECDERGKRTERKLRASWLARKFRKAFSSKGLRGGKGGFKYSPRNGGNGNNKVKFSVPQLQVTESAAVLEDSENDDDDDEQDLFGSSSPEMSEGKKVKKKKKN